MKDHFNRFAIRFLGTLLLGLLTLFLHRWSANAVGGIFLPKYASPWELSKLAYWPMLASLCLTGRLTGGVRGTVRCALPVLALTAPALFLLFWAVSGMEPAAAVYILLWVAASAVAMALADRETPGGSAWLVMAAAVGAAYAIFSFLPPIWGPFLDPADVAAMAVIPY